MFVFVRQDLPLAQQGIQSLHSIFGIANLLRHESGIPNVVWIGLPDQSALRRALAKLKENCLPHYAWHEPDFDYGFTAIATGPLDAEQKKCLSNYRVWREQLAVVA